MEATEQKDFVLWFLAQWPEHERSLRVSMAGLPRHGRKGAIQWNMMKGQGVVKGEADICLALPKGGNGALLVEHKGQGMSRKLTDDQRDYLDYHNGIGNMAVSTRGIEELKNVVAEYMGL